MSEPSRTVADMEKNAKDQTMRLRHSDEEMELWLRAMREVCKREGWARESVSKWVRRVCNEAANKELGGK